MENDGIRIQKVLSDNSICSRRKAEEYIEKGRITINGHKATIGQKVNPYKDIIHLDGERVVIERKKQKLYLMLNKPRGYVTTLNDELGRKCVSELLENAPDRVYPIGRLDKNSEGLLLFTNDGEFANMIMHPRNHISKTYRVTVRPDINDEQAVRLSTGVEIDGQMTLPATVLVLNKEPNRVVLQITIFEGRNRQIRKMCEAVGLEVARLKRTSIGPLKLGMLAPADWRELTPSELTALRNAVIKSDNIITHEDNFNRRIDSNKARRQYRKNDDSKPSAAKPANAAKTSSTAKPSYTPKSSNDTKSSYAPKTSSEQKSSYASKPSNAQKPSYTPKSSSKAKPSYTPKSSNDTKSSYALKPANKNYSKPKNNI